MLEYLSILALLISEEKRSVRRLACATEDDPIFTSGIVTLYQSAAKESEQTGLDFPSKCLDSDNNYRPIGSSQSDNKYLCNLYNYAQLHAFIR